MILNDRRSYVVGGKCPWCFYHDKEKRLFPSRQHLIYRQTLLERPSSVLNSVDEQSSLLQDDGSQIVWKYSYNSSQIVG